MVWLRGLKKKIFGGDRKSYVTVINGAPYGGNIILTTTIAQSEQSASF